MVKIEELKPGTHFWYTNICLSSRGDRFRAKTFVEIEVGESSISDHWFIISGSNKTMYISKYDLDNYCFLDKDEATVYWNSVIYNGLDRILWLYQKAKKKLESELKK